MTLQTLSQAYKTLRLVAPLSGYLMPIETVPDPVFSQKMVGDGVSIDPTSNVLKSPCAGEVVQLHPSHHAITIKTTDGLEILLHIDLDTVELRGKGFSPKVQMGDRVNPGDALIEFDIDYIALHARSLLMQVVVTNSDHDYNLIYQPGMFFFALPRKKV